MHSGLISSRVSITRRILAYKSYRSNGSWGTKKTRAPESTQVQDERNSRIVTKKKREGKNVRLESAVQTTRRVDERRARFVRSRDHSMRVCKSLRPLSEVAPLTKTATVNLERSQSHVMPRTDVAHGSPRGPIDASDGYSILGSSGVASKQPLRAKQPATVEYICLIFSTLRSLKLYNVIWSVRFLSVTRYWEIGWYPIVLRKMRKVMHRALLRICV